jgi:hypothetical protein
MSTQHARVKQPVADGPAPSPEPHAAAPAAPAPIMGLLVGHADDPAEHAADARADAALGRLRAAVPDGDDAPVRRSTPAGAVGAAGGRLDGRTAGRIEALRSSGAPLPGGVRRRMETAFGTGLGHVRLHQGVEAGALASTLSAEAFTSGRDIFVGAGAGAPGTPDGEHVLAHEIAHVLDEPAGIHRLFGRSAPTEEDKRKRAAKKHVAEAKKTEKAELAGLATSRKEGKAGRAKLTGEVWGTGGTQDRSGAQAALYGDAALSPYDVTTTPEQADGKASGGLYGKFDQALEAERTRFAQLTAQRQKGRINGSDRELADLAYQETWFGAFADLKAVRPPRETAAERLVIQVRKARAEGGAQTAGGDAETKVLADKLHGGDVEKAYERIVVERDRLVRDEKLDPLVAEDRAWDAVRKTLDPKVLAKFPQRHTALDVAAWERAETTAVARAASNERAAQNVERKKALYTGVVPADVGELGATSTLDKAEKTMSGDVSTYGGGALKGINAVGGGIAGKIGTGQDRALRAQQNITLSGHTLSTPEKIADKATFGLYSTATQANTRIGSGQRETGPAATQQMADGSTKQLQSYQLPASTASKVSAGFGQATGVLQGLLTAVTSAITMAKSIKQAYQNDDPYAALGASKAATGGLNGLTSTAKSAAELAKTIDPGVGASVAKVIPGFDLAMGVLTILSSTFDVVSSAWRQHETDTALFGARAQTDNASKKSNVLVWPLLRIAQTHTKSLEKSVWSLAVAVIDWTASLAQVVTAGGYGVPAAIKAATTLTDHLHKLGHFIADQVMAVIAQRVTKESAVLHLEGGAEAELKGHPGMAVDGIVMRAAAGDDVALAYLANYRVDGKPITKEFVQRIKPKAVQPFDPKNPGAGGAATSDDELLGTIRDAVLDQGGIDGDPKTVYDQLRDAKKKGADVLSGVQEKWGTTGSLATDRNALGSSGRLGENTKADRGLGWRLKTMFMTEGKLTKLQNRTAAYGGVENLPAGVAAAIGTHELRVPSGGPDVHTVLAWLGATSDQEIEAEIGRKPRRNDPRFIDILREELVRRRTAKKKAPPVPSRVGRPALSRTPPPVPSRAGRPALGGGGA